MQVAAIQMASGPNVNANLIEAERLITRAVDAGAELVVLPENFAIMGLTETYKVEIRETFGTGQIQDFLSEQSLKNKAWIIGGTVPLVANHKDKVRAASLMYDSNGKCVARYDKIHLFDVHIEETNENYNESETIEADDKIVVVNTPFGNIGMSICYDLRFPEMFRSMLKQNVDIIVLPAAFTAITGKAHWETLVRSRAIENLCYVVAAAQGGYHVNGRETYGDSMIVDPWGNILDRLPRGSGFVIAKIDPELIAATRKNFPATQHRKI